jgi:NAD(P)-dependent dehydrogenase (short-subunit alcohol dehydrogenase family)
MCGKVLITLCAHLCCASTLTELAEHGISVIALQPGNIATTPLVKVLLSSLLLHYTEMCLLIVTLAVMAP